MDLLRSVAGQFDMAQLPPILLVDDDADDLFILKRLLAKGGLQNKVVSFEDAVLAVGYLEAESRCADKLLIPFFIVTDLQMPRIDGFRFVEWVRAQPGLRETHVVVVSSAVTPDNEARLLRLGADACLAKYPTVDVLKALVAKSGGTFGSVAR
jgi:CheY-like chemotaxis protein